MREHLKHAGVEHPSIWMHGVDMPACPSLAEDVDGDVCVIGAGIAGLTTAYLLAQEGKSVIVLDDGVIGGGMTQLTTAHLASAIDDRYVEMERLHGETGARLAAQSHAAAIDRIEDIVQKENIACDFTRLNGYLFLPPGENPEFLDEELAAARRAGLERVTKIGRAPLPHFDTGPCLCFPRQGQFHPLKYLAALATAVMRKDGRIYARTHADQVKGGAPARIKADRHIVTVKAVIVATNSPVIDRVAIHTKQAPYMTYVIGVKIPRDSVPEGLYWDTADPYHYVRLYKSAGESKRDADDFDTLIVGGEDHKTGQARDTEERHGRLEAWARDRFPDIEAIEFAWSGQVMETIDGLAFIGRNPLDDDNVFVVTGDSGMGMTHGTIAGQILTDLVMARPNPWAELYDPSRKTIGAAGDYAKEALNMARQYTDWLKPGDVSAAEEIPNEHGAILRQGLRKIAVYRDERGIVHRRSALCPHLGCIVHWNPTEKTWDCPCHGSRFDRYGQVLNGPANRNLEEHDGDG